MLKLNHHQFRQAIGSLIGHGPHSSIWMGGRSDDPFMSDLEAAIDAYDTGAGGLLCPASPDFLFILPERFPLFTDMLKKSRSVLAQTLFERCDDTGLVVDSYLTGKEALHLVKLTSDDHQITDWIQQMCPARMSLTIRPIDEQHKLMIAHLSSFVFPGAS